MKEESIEKFLTDQVADLGGLAVKLNPAGVRGIPDRLVILPGRIIFVELKRPRGGVISKLQHWWADRLRALGHETAFVKTEKEVIDLLHRAT